MPSLLRYAQGCGMSTDDKFLFLLPYKSLPLLEFMRGGSYIQNLISFSYSIPGMIHSVMRFGQVGTTSDLLRSCDCNCDGVIYFAIRI